MTYQWFVRSSVKEIKKKKKTKLELNNYKQFIKIYIINNLKFISCQFYGWLLWNHKNMFEKNKNVLRRKELWMLSKLKHFYITKVITSFMK